MITLRKLKTFLSVDGDVDLLSRGRCHHPDDLSETECRQLNELLQKLNICRGDLVSMDFCESVQKELMALASDEFVRAEIERMVAEDVST